MSDRPILFSRRMIQAILEDRKSQTRRVIKPQPTQDPDGSWRWERNPRVGFNNEGSMRNNLPNRCPYGRLGDRLWVKTSRFMRKAEARIMLEIVRVRVERLWDISDRDSGAEGVSIQPGSSSTHREAFMMLWDSINAGRGYAWEVNPWVWVIEFKRSETKICSLGYDMKG